MFFYVLFTYVLFIPSVCLAAKPFALRGQIKFKWRRVVHLSVPNLATDTVTNRHKIQKIYFALFIDNTLMQVIINKHSVVENVGNVQLK